MQRSWWVWVCAVLLVTAVGCQCGTPPVLISDGGDGDGGSALESDAGRRDAGVFGPDGGLTCFPLREACGSGTLGCCSGLMCESGSCQVPATNPCGLNSLMCGGHCAVVLNDPLNCGVCGRQCPAATVCSRGACVLTDQCAPGLTACQQRCVDLQTDNAFCGACASGRACAAGTGCSNGVCVPLVALDGGKPQCSGGGAPVKVVSDAGAVCAGSLAQVSFRWSVCSCTSVNSSADFRTDGFDSTRGTQDGGLLGAGVGANGRFITSAFWDIGGTGWFAGGVDAQEGTIRQRLFGRGAIRGGQSEVRGDAWVQGSVDHLRVRGVLHIADGAGVGTGVTAGRGIVVEPVSIDSPCGCAAKDLVDVAGIVADGVAHNDNAQLGLDPKVFDGKGGRTRLDLPCGRYALTRLAPNGPITLAIHGRTALFIAGDVNLSNSFDLAIDPTAELDLFVGRNLIVSAQARFGNIEAPAQLRIYVAGTTVATSDTSRIAGNYYLPHAAYQPSASVDLYGSVFAHSVTSSASFAVHYDQAILSAGEACNSPQLPADAGVDGGEPIDGGVCETCRDCGNQACVAGMCGSCATSSDCCAPLVCFDGVCGPQID